MHDVAQQLFTVLSVTATSEVETSVSTATGQIRPQSARKIVAFLIPSTHCNRPVTSAIVMSFGREFCDVRQKL